MLCERVVYAVFIKGDERVKRLDGGKRERGSGGVTSCALVTVVLFTLVRLAKVSFAPRNEYATFHLVCKSVIM